MTAVRVKSGHPKIESNFFKFFSFSTTLSCDAVVREERFRVENMRVECWARIFSVLVSELGLEHAEIRVLMLRRGEINGILTLASLLTRLRGNSAIVRKKTYKNVQERDFPLMRCLSRFHGLQIPGWN